MVEARDFAISLLLKNVLPTLLILVAILILLQSKMLDTQKRVVPSLKQLRLFVIFNTFLHCLPFKLRVGLSRERLF